MWTVVRRGPRRSETDEGSKEGRLREGLRGRERASLSPAARLSSASVHRGRREGLLPDDDA
eukprot:7796938-Pyramimonas_sp.AAC.1